MKVLRWIAVLPVAIVGSMLFYVIARFIGKMFDPMEGYGLMGLMYEAIYSVLLGLMFVVIGSYVAPSHKKTTSVALSILGTIFCVVSLCLQIFVIGVIDWQIIISCVFMAAGCIGGAIQVHKEKKER